MSSQFREPKARPAVQRAALRSSRARKVLAAGLSLTLVVGLAGLSVLTSTTPAEAATIAVSAPQAQMSGHVGTNSSGSANNAQNGDRYRFGSAATATTTGAISNTNGSPGSGANSTGGGTSPYRSDGYTAWVSSGTTAWTAHGYDSWWWGSTPEATDTKLNLGTQSALGFEPSNVTSVQTGNYFNLGRMVHSNNPVTSTSQWFKGNLNIRFMGQDMSYQWLMNETPNDASPATNPANNDLTSFLNQVSDKTFTVDGVTYTLVVAGFTATNAAGNTCVANPTTVTPVNQFSTVEGTSTFGCLYASVEQVRQVTVKKVVASPYGTAPTQSFGFTSTSSLAGSVWSAPGTASLTAGSSFTRNYNSAEGITITEGAQTSPWAFTSLMCVDGTGASVGTVSGQTVTIPKGTTASTAAAAPITCTYTNTYTPRATLTLQKNVVSTGQPAPVAVPANWTLTAQGEGLVAGRSVSGNGNSAAVTSQSVIAGTYTLSEVSNNATATAGYVQDGNWTCTGGVTVTNGQITLTNGQTTTCSVTNRYQTGTLAITKTVTSTPAGGYTLGASKAFTAAYSCTLGTGTTPITGTVTVNPNATNGQAGATVTIPNLPAGALCTVTETNAPTGSTDLANSSWQWGSPSTSPATAVTIPVNGTATANITNPVTQNTGSLVITKQVTPRTGVPGAAYINTSRTFPISYVCTIGSTTTASGTVNVANGASETVNGIPATSNCVVSETLAAQAGDFLDASFRWDGNAYTQAAAVPVNGTATATVTNYFTRDLVDLTIAKVVSGGGYAGGDFAIDWTCGTGAAVNGTVSLAGGEQATVKVPAGVACSVVEQAGRPDLAPGYVWGQPVYAGFDEGQSTVSVPRGATRTVTITNPTSIGFNRISLTKQIAHFADQVTTGTQFTVQVTCDAPAQGQAGNYSDAFTFTTPLSGAQMTPYLPIGTSCTVVETGIPSGSTNLPGASYAWSAAPTYQGLTDGSVTVPQSTTPAAVIVINDITRVYGPLSITKNVTVPLGVTVSEPFTGAWSCTFGGSQVANGTWTAPPSGGAATLSDTTGDHAHLLVGSFCTVTEAAPANPVPGDDSYSWAVTTPTNLTPITVDGVNAPVNNVLNRATGTFQVTKSVTGGTAGAQFADTEFTFDYVCHPLSGADLEGTLTMLATGSASPEQAIPAGSVCTVTERLNERPTPIDPFRWDGVTYAVSGAAGTAVGENGVRFTIPAGDAQVSVTATNAISAKSGSLTVSKQVTQLDGGFVGGDRALFPMTLTCVDPVSGASGVVPVSPQSVGDGGSYTWHNIPLGAECSVQEGSIGDADGDGLKDASFAWNAPTYSAAHVSVVDSETREIVVTNTLRRVYGEIALTKVFDDGGYVGVVPTGTVYNGTWECAYDGNVVAAGTWSGSGSPTGVPALMETTQGDAATIPLTSSCSVDENSLSAPSTTDESYRWLPVGLDPIESVSATVSENVMIVTNTLTRDTGSITVQKTLSGEVAGFGGGADFPGFDVSYVCALDPADFTDDTASNRMAGNVLVQPGASAVVLATGVPRGWDCQVREAVPDNAWLVDDSFVWGTASITVNGGAQTGSFELGTTAAVVVDNPILRQTGTIVITKQIADGFDRVVADDATFSGAYVCVYAEGTDREATYNGTWTVDRTGAATVTGDTVLPYGTTCSVTESDPSDADLIDASWTWGQETVAAGPDTVSGDGPASFTVTNTPVRVYSALAITKVLTGPAEGFTDPALTVSGTWVCTYPGETPISGTWTALAAGGPAVLTPSDAQIPATSNCIVREDTLDADVFRDASYGWGGQPAVQEVAVPANEAAQVTVTNTVERLQGNFTITKLIDRGAGVTEQVPGTDVTYSGTYECAYEDVSTGPLAWSITGEGNTFTAPQSYYASTVCRVLDEAEPSRAPVPADSSFWWAQETIGPEVTVGVSTAVNVDVTNQVRRNTGTFAVTKVFAGDPAGLPEDPTYTFEWSCVAENGDSYPTNADDAIFAIPAGGSWQPEDAIPASSRCTVTETGIPDPIHETFTWSTALVAAGAPASSTGLDGEGRPTITFDTPDEGGAGVEITATNTLTRGLGGFSVTKSVPEGSVTDEGMTFSGEYSCRGPLDSDEPVTGTWGPIAAGAVWTSDATIPLASDCAVTSEERSVWPYAADRSYQWDGDADLGEAVVSAVEPAVITVTNTTHRVLGSVTWQKVSTGSGDLLAGSTWTLTGPDVPEDTVVVDCIEAGCPAGAYLDQNPAPGEFSLTDLAWGDYTILEKAAPAGYYLNTSVKHFTIGSDEPGVLDVVDVGQIENTPINPPTIPLTGGLGRDFFTILGAGVLLLGLGAMAVLRISRRRRGAVEGTE